MSKRRTKQSWIVVGIGLLITVAYQLGWFGQLSMPVEQLQPGQYRVASFSDGDTITVDMDGRQERIRMIGVDTPETHDPRKEVQCFGQAASDFTKQLIGTHGVRLSSDAESTNRDRYDRLLRYVYLPDGTLVNGEIIKQGYGFAYTSFPFTKSDEFRRYEQEARDNSRGLWAQCNPQLDNNGYISSPPAT